MSDENVIDLDEVLISPVAFREYHEFAKRIARALGESGLMPNPENIPDEQGRVEADGSLTIFVRLPNGIEVSMRVPKEHWQWTRRQ
jgi:hypothetical protein